MIRDKLSRMESNVKSCFVLRFDAGANRFPPLTGKLRAFRDPAAIPIAQLISEALRGEGYETTDAKPGKACHAGFECKFEQMHVSLVMLMNRVENGFECALDSRPWRSLWKRWAPLSLAEVEEWQRLNGKIDQIVKAKVKPDAYRWLTFHEAEEAVRW